MRKLGQELGVEAMALYYHFANKDEVIDGIVDLVFAEIELPVAGRAMEGGDAPPGDLRPRRAAAPPLGDRPDGGTRPSRAGEPAPPRRGDRQPARGRLRRARWSPTPTRVLDGYIYGFALTKMNLPFELGRHGRPRWRRRMLEPFPFDEYPNLAAFVTEHIMQPGYDFGDEFEYGLDLILDGLERVAPRG